MAELVSTPRVPIPPALRKEVADLVLERWWVRALLATEKDRLGLVLRAVFALPTNSAPWLGPSAIVDDKGMVLSNWVDEHNHRHFAAGVCTLEDLIGNLRRLCDTLGFTQMEAEMLFAKVRQWITIDCRPASEQPEDRIPIEYRRDG